MLNTVKTVELNDILKSTTIEKLAHDIFRVHQADGKSVVIEVLAIDLPLKTMTIRQQHTVYDLVFKDNLDMVLDKMGIKRSVDTISTDIKAPMPGKVIGIMVNPGDAVSKGDGILILEAMKMENIIRTDHDVTIEKIAFNEGEPVGIGQMIMKFAS